MPVLLMMGALFNLLCPSFQPLDWPRPDVGPALFTIVSCCLASVKFPSMSPRLDLEGVAVGPGSQSKAQRSLPPMTGFELRTGSRVNLPLSVGLLWMDIVLIRGALLISYMLDHFSASTAVVAMHRREFLAFSPHSVLPCALLMVINPLCLMFASPSRARTLMIAKTVLVGIVAFLTFSAPVGYP